MYNTTHLSTVVGRCTAHVIMYSGEHRNGFLSDIDASEDHGGLRDAGQALLQLLGRQVVQLQVHMVFLRPTAAACDIIYIGFFIKEQSK